MKRRLFTLLCGAILFGTSVGAADFSIGDYPVEIELPGQWRRKASVPGLGNDQFFSQRTSVRVAVIQRLTPLGGKPAIDFLFASMMDSMSGPSLVSMAPREVLVDQGDRYALAQSAILREAGIEVSYRWMITSRGGLTHIVIGFVPKPKQKHLQQILDPLVKKFPRPAAGSKWDREGGIISKEVSRDWGKVVFTHRPVAWGPGTADDAFFELDHSDGESLYFFEYDDWDAEDLADSLTSHYASTDYALIHPPKNRTYLENSGPEFRAEDPDGNSIRSWLIPIGDRSFLEVRLETGHSKEVADSIWESLFSSIAIELAPPVFAFPRVEEQPSASSPPPAAPQSVQAWLGGARWLGTAEGIRASGAFPVGDRWIVYGNGGIQELTADRSSRWIDQSDRSYRSGAITLAADNSLLYRWGLEQHRFVAEDQRWVAIEPRTSARVQLGSVRFQIEMPESRSQVGFSGLPEPNSPILVRIEGTSRTEVGPLTGKSAQWLVADRAGEHALIALEPVNLDESRPRWDLVDLQILHRDGSIKPLTTGWHVEAIAGGDGEWLVTGKPAEGIGGVYRVPLDGEPEMLLSGSEFRGVAIDADHVVVSGRPYEPALQSNRGTALYRVDRAVLVEWGPKSAPHGCARLNEIARRAIESTEGGLGSAFGSAEGIRSFLARASKVSEDLCSVPLPAGKALDTCFAQWIDEARLLNPDGIALITAMVTAAFLDSGAEWVASRTPISAVPILEPMRRATSFGIVRNPGRIVWTTLFDDDSYWRPISEVTRQVEGRTLYLGFDGVTLMGALMESSDVPAFAILEKDADSIGKFLTEHRENIYLRYEIYEHLMARGRYADLQACAKPFLQVEQPLFFDRRAALGARYAAGETSETEKLIEDLLDFVRRYPRAPAAYDLLAHTYLRRGGPDDGRRARACFERVLSLTEDGDEVDRARAGLDSLGE